MFVYTSSNYLGRPKPPGYLPKVDGRQVLTLTNQSCKIVDGCVVFPKRFGNARLKTTVVEGLQQVRLVPRNEHYVIEVVYKKSVPVKSNLRQNVAGVDLGLRNIVTMVDNVGGQPLVVKGGALKSVNQFYDRERARLMSIIGIRGTSRRLTRLTNKRNAKVNDLMHKISRLVVNFCRQRSIDTLVVGNNATWKQGINIGKVNNQNFVSVPHSRLIDLLVYKCEDVGIDCVVTEEAYTSKSSFLDGDELPVYKAGVHHTFSGRRTKRGVYVSGSGVRLNADVNGAYNIIRKAVPKAFKVDGIEDVGLHPLRVITTSQMLFC